MDPTEQRVNDLIVQGHWAQALSLIETWPEQPFTLWVRANYLLQDCGDDAGAEVLLRRLLASPGCPDQVHLRLGKALHGQDRVAEALHHYLRAVLACRRQPGAGFEHAVNAYGLACLELGLHQHWLDVLQRLDDGLQPLPMCAYLAAMAHLSLGQWRSGWALLEQREPWFHRQDGFSCPFWQGQVLEPGATVLISSDMGIGDFLFFLRFVPELRHRHASLSLVLLVPPALKQLALVTDLFDQIVTDASQLSQRFPWQLRLASLPALLGVEQPDHFPRAGYLQVPETARSAWSDLASASARTRPLVAINWAGNRAAESPGLTVRGRSLSLDQVESIQALHQVDLISVQVGAEPGVLQSSLAHCCHPVQCRFDGSDPDLIDTAAVLSHCDLLITNDTSVAHLGGALGCPTWVMLKRHPSWQWGEEGSTPWYGSVCCFRQHRAFDWTGVMVDVDQALAVWLRDWHRRRGIPESPGP